MTSKLTSVAGFLILMGVIYVAVLDRGQAEIRYFDWHAAAVVLGGVLGSLLLAFNGRVFGSMASDWLAVVTGRDSSQEDLERFSAAIEAMQSSWQDGRRADVLAELEKNQAPEIRAAADTLIQRASGHRLKERFEFLRVRSSEELLPQIEGWDMVARLGPSFGIVGTVAGMVTLFRNMADRSGNLGGAMALALLATLYGILLGTAIGGPMSARLNNRLNRRIGLIDLLERQTAALIDEDSGARGADAR
jgi:chemotaxis protein MotA